MTGKDVLATIQGDSAGNIEVLEKEWECRDPRLWRRHQELFLEFGKSAIALGKPILAFDILQDGRSHFPDNNELAYYMALALVRSGSTGHAAEVVHHLLESVDRSDPLYIQVQSLAGRVAKDRWEKSPEGPDKQAFLVQSALFYCQAYELSGGDYFPGINAATMSILAGQETEGRRIAARVYHACRTLWSTNGGDDYWLAATLGESCLLREDLQEAALWYSKATRLAGKHIGDIAIMRRQARLLVNALALDDTVLESLEVGSVAVFSGHMLDMPGREVPRFPSQLEGVVQQAIAEVLERFDVRFGYAAAACGSDILFLESLLERNAEAHIILPFRQDDFIDTSVAFAGPEWIERFHRVIDAATSVRCAVDEAYLEDDILFTYHNLINTGTALLHAQRLGTKTLGLAVFDSHSVSAMGGTKSAVDIWKLRSNTVEIIALDALRQHFSLSIPQPRATLPKLSERAAPIRRQRQGDQLHREIKTMLFADMVGFSKLIEGSAPAFVVNFLGEVAKCIDNVSFIPAFKNTWGDGLFLVFDEVVAGASFALHLRDRIRQTNWTAMGLPPDTNVRMGMHAGPVFPGMDPIIGRQNFFGSHVNMAARIEPITPAGAIYVSEQYAALLVASGATDFTCDYMGNMSLVKGFGTFPMYRLRRVHEIE